MRVMSSQECAEIVAEFDRADNKHIENGEPYYTNSCGLYNLPTSLKHVDRLTEHVRKKYPGAVFSNSYTREYRRDGELKIHTDRVGLDLTLSVCLEKDIPTAWPLFVSKVEYSGHEWDLGADPAKYFADYDAYDMSEGVGVFCEGRKHPHWRDPLECDDTQRVVYIFYHWTIPAVVEMPIAPVSAGQFRPSMVVAHPDIKVYDNFLSEAECAILIWSARERLKRSTVTDDKNGGSYVDDVRTSHGMYFTIGENSLISHIEAKISALTGLPVDHGEGTQILRYRVGQEYKPHNDYFDPSNPALANLTKNNRICTVLLYLNTPEQGGDTVFPDAGISVSARRGTALVFRYPTATADTKTLHGGTPVLKGEKWVATKWIHQNPYGVKS